MPVPWRRSAELAFPLCQQTTGSVHLALLHKQQVIQFILHAHILLFGVAVQYLSDQSCLTATEECWQFTESQRK